MHPRTPRNPTAHDDDWEDQPTQFPFHKYAFGLLLPIALLAYATLCLATGHATFSARQSSIELHGFHATAYTLAVLAIALFLHCHYFWGNLYDQIWFAVLGKIMAGFLFILCTRYLIIQIGILGRH